MASVTKFLIRRTLMSIIVLLGVITITFVISHMAVPNPARAWIGPHPNPDLYKALMKKYHFDQPLYIQYLYYMLDLLRGNWGLDPYNGMPVMSEILEYFPVTIELSILATIFTLGLGIPLGVISATHKGKFWDNVVRLFYLISSTVPVFISALILLLLFGYWLRIFPTSGELSLGTPSPPRITGLVMIDSLLSGDFPAFFDDIYHLILPSFVLSLTSFGIITRLVRSSMIEVLEKEYIKTARMKGLEEKVVFYKHALRNALIPAVTVAALIVAYFLGGSLFVEAIFSLPGIGRYATEALVSFNIPVVMDTTFLFALIIVTMNLLADILYAILDPRITLE